MESATRKVEFYRHDLTAEHAAAISQVVETPFLTTGPVCRNVEQQLCRYFGAEHSLLTNSWTNGALALLLALGLRPGDEVIIPAMTFIATANVVVLAGGTPVFVDVDPGTLLLMPEAVFQSVTSRTRAVMPVHLYGQMVDVSAMREGLRPDIVLIEDCAHCFEGTRDTYRPSVHSDAAIFSFYATKNVTCGEGGAIVTNSSELFSATREARLHGMSAPAIDRFAGGRYNHWEMEHIGTKANLPDLLAALLPTQIETIDQRLPARKKMAARYREAFSGGPLRLVDQLPNCNSAEHLFVIGVGNGKRDEAIGRLNEAGVAVTVNYRSVPEMAYYRRILANDGDQWPVSRRWGEETISLPLYAKLTAEDQDYVIDCVKRYVFPLLQASD